MMLTLRQKNRKLRRALRLARRFIKREQIEHAIVDLHEPNVGLGKVLDRVLKETK